MSGPVGTRKVLVTGGGTGIGRAVAERLLREGAQVVLTGRRAHVLEDVAREYPGRAFALPCDLSSPEAREGLLGRAATLLCGLDGWVHSAGQAVHQSPGHIDEAALRSQLEVNLVAPLRLGEQALEVLERGGAMVFVASTLAVRPIVTSAVYSAAKAGLLQVMRVLALAGAPRQVRANAVLPGVVDTEMVRAPRLEPGEAPLSATERAARVAAQLDGLRALHPLGRLGSPGDVAAAVHQLLGASWATGTELVLDGGLLLRE
ncbi:SDR family oxidoreductase [Corallococcus sp. M34]|uniref:SDR family NAD(P)-dependent oxidoreductase n=1 Tax=Citreicoccus inhibens TaxID=2849499 RepID=UPI001C228E88|nr:SDR family oxidoreductase [Citreicoccus inhibens]MBU8898031.1 SDR family oxidoreductase [Citreicoccus inhibens]